MSLSLLATGIATFPVDAMPVNPCPGQWVHTYPLTAGNGEHHEVVSEVTLVASYSLGASVNGYQEVHVVDTNTVDCNFDAVPLDFDGDYDAGDHGGFFPYGPWATDPWCNYGLNLHHGPTVVVSDLVFGSNVAFLVGVNDYAGPIMIYDPSTGVFICETDGLISPSVDWDDCLSDADPWGPGYQPYYGVGYNACGAGGGDGGFWVILLETYVEENGYVLVANPHTAGTIVAY